MRVTTGLAAVLVVVLVSSARAGESDLDLAGACVTPHVGTPGVRFQRRPLAPLDARVQLLLRNGTDRSFRVGSVSFNGMPAGEYLNQKRWSWHDTPDVWTDAEKAIPAGALTVWSLNSVDPAAMPGNTLRLDVDIEGQSPAGQLTVAIERPRLWLAAVTFVGKAEDVRPNQMILHIRNETDKPQRIEGCRLFLPRDRDTWRCLYPRPWLDEQMQFFSEEGIVKPSEINGVRVTTGPLPLTYAAVEVRLRGGADSVQSIWSYLRIKKERFDISGGWVNSATPAGPSLTHEPFLKTLHRMHVNTAHIGDIPARTACTRATR